MSVQAISWVLDNSPTVGTDRLVLISLANHADQRGESSWPSVFTIMREAGASERAVQTSLRNLATEGRIDVVRNGAPDERIPHDKRPNLYRVLMTHAAARRANDPLAQHACDHAGCTSTFTSKRGLDLHRRSHEIVVCACGKSIRRPGLVAHKKQCDRGVMDHAPVGRDGTRPAGRDATRDRGVMDHAPRGVMGHTQTVQGNRPITVPGENVAGALELRVAEPEAEEDQQRANERRGTQLVAELGARLAEDHADLRTATRFYAPWDAGCRTVLGRRLAELEANGWPATTLIVELAGVVIHDPDRVTSIAGLLLDRARKLDDRPYVHTATEHAEPARRQAADDRVAAAAAHGHNLARAELPPDEIAYVLAAAYAGPRHHDELVAALAAAGVDAPSPAREVWA